MQYELPAAVLSICATGFGPYWEQQELDDANDGDSAFGDGSSSTTSLSASIFEYRSIHGRSFHSDKITGAQYWSPTMRGRLRRRMLCEHFFTWPTNRTTESPTNR